MVGINDARAAEGFRQIVRYAATLDDDGQAALLDGLEQIGPAAVVGTYLAARDSMKSGQLGFITPYTLNAAANAQGMGFFDNIGKFFEKAAGSVKKVAQSAAPIAAPFLSLIPGVGPALSAGALALGSGGDPQLYAAQQQTAQQQLRAMGLAVANGQTSPETIAAVRKSEQAKKQAAVLRERLAAQKKLTAQARKTQFSFKNPVVIAGAVGAGVLFLSRRRR